MKRTNKQFSAHHPEQIIITDDDYLYQFSSDGYLSVNKLLLEHYGPQIAILFSNLVDKYRYFKQIDKLKDGAWFFLKNKDQCRQTGMSEGQIRNCKKKLETDGVIQTDMKGVPAKQYYKINTKKLQSILSKPLKSTLNASTPQNHRAKGKVLGSAYIYTYIKENKVKELSISKDIYDSPDGNHLEKLSKEVEDIILHWNSLPNVTSHQIKDTKTCQQCCNMILCLLLGIPLEYKKDLTPTKPFDEFLYQNNIPQSLVERKWAVKEIKNILNQVKKKYNFKTRPSLPGVLWSKFSGKGGANSLFLLEAAKKKTPPKYKKLASMFKKIQPTKNVSKLEGWARDFQNEIEADVDKDYSRLKKALIWLIKNKDDKYTPKAVTPIEFCGKLLDIEAAIKRGYSNGQSKKSIGFKSKTIQYDEGEIIRT